MRINAHQHLLVTMDTRSKSDFVLGRTWKDYSVHFFRPAPFSLNSLYPRGKFVPVQPLLPSPHSAGWRRTAQGWIPLRDCQGVRRIWNSGIVPTKRGRAEKAAGLWRFVEIGRNTVSANANSIKKLFNYYWSSRACKGWNFCKDH